MKKLILGLLLLLSPVLFAQEYYVLYLKGKIQDANTKEWLKVGHKIDQKDALKFFTPDAKAVLIGKQSGRFVVKPNTQKNISEIAYLVSHVISEDHTAHLSTRSTQNNVWEGIFSEKYAVIDHRIAIDFDQKQYPDDLFGFRVGNYYKVLPTENGQIILDKYQIFEKYPDFWENESVRGELVYDQQKLASFELSFLDEDEISASLSILCQTLRQQQLTKTEILIQIEDFILTHYGKTDTKALLAFLGQKNLLVEP